MIREKRTPGGYRPEHYWQERLSKRFDASGVGHASYSESYNRWIYRAKKKALRKALASHRIEIEGKAVCDVGCGTGFFIDFYLRGGACALTGVDITAVSIERLTRRYPGLHCVRGDISAPGFAAALAREHDIVNAFDVLYHITDDDAFDRALLAICRLCRPGGWALISDLFPETDRDEAAHVRFRSMERYRRALGAGGMTPVSVHPLYFILNRPVAGVGLDNLLSPLYYALDSVLLSRERSNIKLLVARKAVS
jgi:SAM-dependent methyltransferase